MKKYERVIMDNQAKSAKVADLQRSLEAAASNRAKYSASAQEAATGGNLAEYKRLTQLAADTDAEITVMDAQLSKLSEAEPAGNLAPAWADLVKDMDADISKEKANLSASLKEAKKALVNIFLDYNKIMDVQRIFISMTGKENAYAFSYNTPSIYTYTRLLSLLVYEGIITADEDRRYREIFARAVSLNDRI